MTIKTKTDLISEQNSRLPDNITHLINPADVREPLNNIVDSLQQVFTTHSEVLNTNKELGEGDKLIQNFTPSGGPRTVKFLESLEKNDTVFIIKNSSANDSIVINDNSNTHIANVDPGQFGVFTYDDNNTWLPNLALTQEVIDALNLGTISQLDEIGESNLDSALQMKVNRSAPNKFDGTVPPTANDDSANTSGSGEWEIGSVWIDIVSDPRESYRCVDDTPTSAVWINTTLTTDELGDLALQNANSINVSGGVITGLTTPLSISSGGTGANNETSARISLGLQIGNDVQAYDANTAKTHQNQTWTASQKGGITTLTSSANVAIDLNDNNNFELTLTSNAHLDNPSNLSVGQSGTIIVRQDGSGSRTLEFGTQYLFAGGEAPTLTTTASALDVLAYQTINSTAILVTAILDVQ